MAVMFCFSQNRKPTNCISSENCILNDVMIALRSVSDVLIQVIFGNFVILLELSQYYELKIA